MSAPHSVLVLKLANQLFSIKLHYVQKVILYTKMKSLPGMASFFKGMINVHGRNTPIIDLHERLGIKPSNEYTVNTPIILTENTKQPLGLIVEDIIGIEDGTFEPVTVQAAHANETSMLSQGIIQSPTGESVLIDVNKLCTEAIVLE